MARVTIEDCTEVVNSRFELVVLAAQRAKEISSGAKLTVDRDNDKDAVVALREIAARNIDITALKESVIKRYLSMPLVDNEDSPEATDTFEIQQEMRTELDQRDMSGMSYQDELEDQ